MDSGIAAFLGTVVGSLVLLAGQWLTHRLGAEREAEANEAAARARELAEFKRLYLASLRLMEEIETGEGYGPEEVNRRINAVNAKFDLAAPEGIRVLHRTVMKACIEYARQTGRVCPKISAGVRVMSSNSGAEQAKALALWRPYSDGHAALLAAMKAHLAELTGNLARHLPSSSTSPL